MPYDSVGLSYFMAKLLTLVFVVPFLLSFFFLSTSFVFAADTSGL